MMEALSLAKLMHKFLCSYNFTILYMFRALLCSSSGGQIVRTQHLVLSFPKSGRGGHAVHTTCILHDNRDYF
jgi:hypothetical protein